MSKASKTTPERALLVRLVEQGYDKQAWQGPNLKGAIRRISAKQASWRPKPGRHNIAEIVVHCAYWKYAVRRRIRGDKRGSFPLKGSNWFQIPSTLTDRQWRSYVALLEASTAHFSRRLPPPLGSDSLTVPAAVARAPPGMCSA